MKSNLKILTLATLLFHFVSFSQNNDDYLTYYNWTNEGDKQVYLKNDSAAYECYLEAFQYVNLIHSEKLIKAAELAAKLGDDSNAYEFSKLAIIQGTEDKFYKKKGFKTFRKSTYYSNFKDSLSHFKKEYTTNLNADYKRRLDSLYYMDQKIVRGAKFVKGDFDIDNSQWPEDRYELDSLIFLELLSLIDKYGFATERNVGSTTFINVWVLYHHNFRLPRNEKHLELAKQALLQGAYMPQDYAWMYDQSRMWKEAEPFFFYGVLDTSKMNEEKKKTINQRRAKWGVKPLESQKTIQKGKLLIQRNLW